MNDNYLLHNETAKKLYFEYAKDLPIISLCSEEKPSDLSYNNVAEAFLLNDFYKLDAMRHCGVEEILITGDSSDYEKFKAFCSVLPKFAGHPLYLLSHIELYKHFGCELTICEDNCDLIWEAANIQILNNSISMHSLLKQTNIEYYYCSILSWMDELYSNKEILDLSTLENHLIEKIRRANDTGCTVAIYNAFSDLVKPNPYAANEIVKKIRSSDTSLDIEECDLLDIQIARTLGKEYVDLGWSWLLSGNTVDDDVIEYLKNNGALPQTSNFIEFEIGQSEDYLELQIRGYAMKYPIGNLICTVNTADNCLSYARHDYFRRTLCNIIGKWVENGEYTTDENALKRLIQNVLYYNLKEAIN